MPKTKDTVKSLRRDMFSLMERLTELMDVAPTPLHEMSGQELDLRCYEMLSDPSVWNYWRQENLRAAKIFGEGVLTNTNESVIVDSKSQQTTGSCDHSNRKILSSM